ncbi:MAG: T9SS type A sorting domain-containing protein, partial [Ignavibacteria bacterium]|nr:T9SS type A sorting domain-containing protein [Ignavibacteria bacterium]
IPNYIQTSPVGGYPSQLYATENPLTNFGPFSQAYIDSIFGIGGIIVSYVGHSGTKIWDNGIEDVNQLKNKFNKYPLISDFGCSTGKFAEPDIVSFSETFTNGLDGDAISYLGNSSLGFTSTSYNYPKLYFEQITNLENTNISSAHISAKLRLLENYGMGGSIKLFVLTNSLLGDPIISLRIPAKPNLNINISDIRIPSFLDDNLDSIEININYRNLGRVDSNSFSILVEDYLNSTLVFQKVIQHQLPLNEKFMKVQIPIKNRPGEHTLVVTLDSNNEIDEIYTSDNSATTSFNVLSSSVRAIVADSIKIVNNGNLAFLNSVRDPISDTILVRLSSTPDFQQYSSHIIPFDTLISKSLFTNLIENERYWYRTSLLSSPETIFETNSFIYHDSVNYNFNFSDSLSTKDFNFTNSSFTNGSIQLAENNILLDINSAGYEDGGIAKIELDGVDYPQNSFGCGFHIVVFDEDLIQYEDYRWFNYWNVPNSHEAFYDYLNTIDSDKLVAISIGGSCGGFVVLQELKDKLKEFGSTYIDSVTWYTSWFMLGRLGSVPGSVPEGFSSTGPVGFDTTFVRNHLSGSFSSNLIGNSGNWKSLNINADSIFSNSQIAIRPIIHNVEKDTLAEINLVSGTANIGYLNSYLEIPISFLVEINSNEYGNSPLINQFKVDYDLVPELGTNYQVVTIASDSVLIGEDAILKFFVYNVGETTADSFKILVDVVRDDNSRENIFSQKLDSLKERDKHFFVVPYNTSTGSGNKTFLIEIDPDDEITELFEDNNFFTIPFYVKPDTTTPSITLTIDGADILDGEYISPNPEIHIELNDQSLLPITDPTSVLVYLNEELIPSDTSVINYQFSEDNPKVVVDFTPTLSDGEYELKVLWRDSNGNIVDSSGVSKYFLISNEAKILNVYNYPNPTNGETHFTFKLTQIPEEIKIKIFTIAGRLVKELKLTSSDLKFDFNKIYWNGRDEDGDILANGVYLYKVIMKAGDKTEDITQKLAIVK